MIPLEVLLKPNSFSIVGKPAVTTPFTNIPCVIEKMLMTNMNNLILLHLCNQAGRQLPSPHNRSSSTISISSFSFLSSLLLAAPFRSFSSPMLEVVKTCLLGSYTSFMLLDVVREPHDSEHQ